MSAGIILAADAERGDLFAAFDAQAHHVEPGVRNSRFAARLAPFRSREEAERALIAEGAVLDIASVAHGR